MADPFVPRNPDHAKFKTGLIPTSRAVLLATPRFHPPISLVAAPPRPIVVPSFLEMWLNDQYGDCVTAEEAAAVAFYSVMCGLPESKITDSTVKAFCDKYDFLNGANLPPVMDKMASDGFHQDAGYKDGPYQTVDFSNESVLQAALEIGPVKIGIDSSALPSGAGNANGWHSSGGRPGQYQNEDHCVALWNYGSSAALFQSLGAQVPAGFPSTGYHLYTWSTIGVVDHAWVMSTCGEAWVRNPTTVGVLPTPPPPPPPPPPPVPTPSWFKEVMDGLLTAIITAFPNNAILVAAATWLKSLIDGWFSTVDHRATLVIPWTLILTMVATLLQVLGPLAVPYIEAMIARLNLPPVLVAIIDQLIEQYLGKPVVR